MAAVTETLGGSSPRLATGQASPWRVVRVIWLREVLVFARDRIRLISAMAMPLMMLVIFSEGLGRTIGSFQEGINFRQFMFPGIVAMTVLMNSVFSGMSIIRDREFGFLREILVAPISRTAIAFGKLFGGATVAVGQGCLMFVFAPILGVSLSPIVVIQLIGIMFLLSLTMASVGIAIGSRMKSIEGFQMVTQMTIMPAMFLSGIFFPVNNLPLWLEILAKINPVTYAVTPIRRIALENELAEVAASGSVVNIELFGHALSTVESLAILVSFGAVMLFLAVRSFRAQE